MDQILIKGGKTLKGEVEASGSKNSILPLLFSTLLAEGVHIFHRVPHLQDVKTACLLLKNLGLRSERKESTLKVFSPKKLSFFKADYDLMRTMRAGILCLGPLLARSGKAQVSLPGGCAIGSRPVNWHIESLKKMGAKIHIQSGYIHGQSSKSLFAAEIHLEKPSVGATQNIMMAATLAQGKTLILGSAKEPEIKDLAEYLNKMGAKIQNAGTSVIQIEGVSVLKPSEHTVISDRIEAATLLLAGAITKGQVQINRCLPKHLIKVLSKLKEIGFRINQGPDWIHLSSPKSFKPLSLSTSFYPGFPTDLQAQFMALMTQAQGQSVIEEHIFENRFMHVPELIRLNAQISIQKNKAFIQGPCRLKGATLTATDLRASSCLILAGLVAKGETSIRRVYHLDRGYEKLEKKLADLGADIQRV